MLDEAGRLLHEATEYWAETQSRFKNHNHDYKVMWWRVINSVWASQ